MNILSYRGPGKAGGVSGALARIVDRQSDDLTWWYLSDAGLSKKTKSTLSDGIIGFPDSIIQGHYRYCNNFLWPILHDMGERAFYDAQDHEFYRQFNTLFARYVMRETDRSYAGCFFVQDYQLALLPTQLSRSKSAITNLFWHIPWPRRVERAHVSSLVEIAEALLASHKLGFHTGEYAKNFMNFVRLHLHQFEVDFDTRRIVRIESKFKDSNNFAYTQIEVLPLGLDWQFWQESVELENLADLSPVIRRICSGAFILSVDRADYTKGILQRIQAIDHFFDIKPEFIGELTFLQVCQQSRQGLPQFDRYWQQTQNALQELNNRWQRDNWQPLVWIQEPLISSQLAALYARTTAMLVSPLRDGLNLTAKEFIACSQREDSMLLLSPGAGVSHEIGDLSIIIEPNAPVLAAQQIARSLSLPKVEKAKRMAALKEKVQDNPLDLWWTVFTNRNLEYSTTVIWADSKSSDYDYQPARDEGVETRIPTII